MLFNSVFRVLPAALLLCSAQGSPVGDLESRQATIDSFISTQAGVSINGVLANIGGGGNKAPGVSAGIVVASPSRSNPDCKHPDYPGDEWNLTTNRLVHLDP
jgi:glucoamylase